MQVHHSRDALLTNFGKATLTDRYLMEGESFQDLFGRVAKSYSYDDAHAQRIYDYISKLWFMPATPVLSNAGNERGLPISCFLSEAEDNMDSIVSNWEESIWLSLMGGGLGINYANIRSISEKIGRGGKSSGVIPFIKVQDSLTMAVNQGGLRRASAAIYMPIHHPEIKEFIEIRRPTGGDPNRKALNIHNAVVVDNKFMEAVEKGTTYDLVSPKDKHVTETVDARDLWQRILTARIETGEPYIMFEDRVNELRPQHLKTLGLKVKMSNLCSEIVLPTGRDYLGKNRTAVCCLSSLNLETYDEWKDNDLFILDIMYFLDNALEDFIRRCGDTHKKARYSAVRERSIGLGVMGLHSLYQQRHIAFSSPEAYALNEEIFKHIKEKTHQANVTIADVRGACPDARDAGVNLRFSHCTAIAPTASISVICGGASPGIEPYNANFYTHKTLSGSFKQQNKYLERVLEQYGKNTQEVWSSIANHEGSVQHLSFLSQAEKEVFKTFIEIDQMDIIKQAADRTPYIDQAQSVNIYMLPTVSKTRMHEIHMAAWKLGLKTLYYCRSKSVKRVEKLSETLERKVIEKECKDEVCGITPPAEENKYETCEACQ